jgi:AcrR family transcriptional regulator
MASTTKQTQPAHRPSRRNDIIDAAIRLFARKGFVDAAISDVAEEADVVVTAVYYHFSGKEELFSAAVHRVFESISEVVAQARAADAPADNESLGAVIDAVWEWIDTHPDEATLFYLQLPGATRQITTLRQEFEELHVERAFGYIGSANRGRSAAARKALETLAARTLVDLLISVHTMRLAHGPLSDESGARLRAAVHDLSQRLVSVDA